jgi:uncharacterized protein (TIGR03435 family)
VKNIEKFATVFAWCAWSALGQTAAAVPPAFEVASIKLSNAPKSEMGAQEAIHASPGSLTMNNVTMTSCLKWAYKVQDPQIFSGPAWIRADRFTIAAKSGEPAGDDQLRAMLQTLLTDRFKMALHRESKTMTAFALVAGRSGVKVQPSGLTPSTTEGEPEMQGRLKFVARRFTMTDLAAFVAGNTQSLVVDMTGMSGRFDFTVDISPYFSIDTPMRKDEVQGILAAAYQSALQAQLGLKLESRKAPVEVLVIDHAEKPTEN